MGTTSHASLFIEQSNYQSVLQPYHTIALGMSIDHDHANVSPERAYEWQIIRALKAWLFKSIRYCAQVEANEVESQPKTQGR